MSLFNKFTSWASGTGWVDQEERGKALDATKAEQDRAAYESGVWDLPTYQQVQERAAETATGDYEAEIGTAFGEGLAEGVNNVRNTIGGTISRIFNLVPWQVWVIGGIALFVWLGGLVWAKGKLGKK